jgi:hypothetical protein
MAGCHPAMLTVNSRVETRFGRLRPLFDGAVAFRQSLKGSTAQPPYIALAFPRRGNYPPSHDLMDNCRLACVVQRFARGVEGFAHCLGGGIVKDAARNEWKYGRHANTLSRAKSPQSD